MPGPLMPDQLPNRARPRLAWFDYSDAGAYFVTICARDHKCVFGEMEEGQMRLSAIGETVKACWNAIPEHFPHVALDAFVIMPNHVHGILLFADRERAGHARPLPTVISSFKSAVSRRVGRQVWQRKYWEHIIRDDDELNSTRAYIEDNPVRWPVDEENPTAACS